MNSNNKFFVKLNSISFLTNFWLIGLLILLFILIEKFLGFEGESLEWSIYICTFIIALLAFFISMFNLKLNILIKLLFSIPFYILILLYFSNSIANLILILGLIIHIIGKYYIEEKFEFHVNDILYLIYYFIIFYISSQIVYWVNLEDFIWYKVLTTSNYYQYVNIIEFYSPIMFISVFFMSIILIIFSLKKDYNLKLLYSFWWIIPAILFFFESFSTAGFFDTAVGSAMYHWQPYIGPMKMINQGGYLLSNVPSIYGFFSIIFPNLIPFGDEWQKFYIFNGFLRFCFGFLIFIVIWNRRGIIWYLISICLTLSLVYYLPDAQVWINSSTTPSGGAMRYFWVTLLLYVVVNNRHQSLRSQVFMISPIWLIGFLWSFESAFFVSSVLGPFFLYHIFFSPNRSFKNMILICTIPFSLIFIILIISIYYIFQIGIIPNYIDFAEIAFANTQGYNSELFTLKTPLWIHAFILSWLITQLKSKKKDYILFCIWFGLWAVLSYSIGQSVGIGLLKILVIFIFGFFLYLNTIEEKIQKNIIYNFIPIFALILSVTFGTMYFAKHLLSTINNQNYFLKNIIHEESSDFHEILTMIKPNNTPVLYFDPSRYLNFQYKNQYKDTKNKKNIDLNSRIWLPIYPASTFLHYNSETKIKYIRQWLNNNPINRGWLIAEKDNYWYKSIQEAINQDFSIENQLEYGNLKAILYIKN